MNENNVKKSFGDHLFKLANRVIGLLYLVIWMILIIVIGLVVTYVFVSIQPGNYFEGASTQMQVLLIKLWEAFALNISTFVKLVAPLFILLFALGILHRLGQIGASPFNREKLFSDLPSVLALIIIITICLLPLSGISVPDVLSNIALVVVGFYFGKREIESGRP